MPRYPEKPSRSQKQDAKSYLVKSTSFPSNKQQGEKYMLSKIPTNLEKIPKVNIDNEIPRAAIIAELDAINLYEQMAALTENKNIKTILLDIAKEEKTHVGEFQTLLLKTDKQQEKELYEGKKEVEEKTT